MSVHNFEWHFANPNRSDATRTHSTFHTPMHMGLSNARSRGSDGFRHTARSFTHNDPVQFSWTGPRQVMLYGVLIIVFMACLAGIWIW